MSSAPYPTYPQATPFSATGVPPAVEGNRVGRVMLFLAAPFLVFAYYTAVTVLKFVDPEVE